MDPSIRERLGLRAPARPLTRARAERVLAARSLMYVFLVGALVAAVALGSPVSDNIDGLRISITGSCAALVAVILLVGYDRLPRWALSVCLLCGSMMRERIDTLLRSLDAANKTDMLTGLLDENGFTQILEKEKERAGRNGHRMALAIGELDGDRSLAERYGSRESEKLLAETGEVLG